MQIPKGYCQNGITAKTMKMQLFFSLLEGRLFGFFKNVGVNSPAKNYPPVTPHSVVSKLFWKTCK